jgi:hypothetical protein
MYRQIGDSGSGVLKTKKERGGREGGRKGGKERRKEGNEGEGA